MQAAGRTATIWQHRNFLTLIGAAFLVNFGGRVYELALPLLIYELSGSSVAMGTMRAVEFLPNLLFAMFIGVFVDRADKKRWLLVMTALQAAILLALYTYTQFEPASLVTFYVAGFCLMLCNYAYANAQIASVKLALPTALLTSANAKFTFIQTLMQVMGPAISGTILFLSSLYYGLLFTGLMYLCALAMLTRLQLDEAPRSTRTRAFWQELGDGWRALRENRPLWVIMWFVVFLNSTNSVYEVMLIFFVKDELQWSTAQVGAILSCAGLGGLLGSLLVEHIRRRWGLGRSLAISTLVLAVTYGFTGFVDSAFALATALFAFGFMTTVINVLVWTYRHETTPAELIGRVSGITGAIFKLGLPFALFGSGYFAAAAGAQPLFVTCALLQCLVFAAFMLTSAARQP